MAKRKDIQYELLALEKENQDLRATIKSLRKKLRNLTELDNALEDITEDLSKQQPVNNAPNLCPKCGLGEIITVKIAGRQFDKCAANPCKWRTTAIMDGKNGKSEKS